jgi:hypothetical protein
MIISEKSLYKPICVWLDKLLNDRYKNSQVIVADTSTTFLSAWLRKRKLSQLFPDSECYDFKIDITGAIVNLKNSALYFIECKASYITIKDISQIMGYSRIANPSRSIIISPKGASTALQKLIIVRGRSDILNYSKNSKDMLIRICKWDINKNCVDYNDTIPLGLHP